jgi:carotenoid 1,2-hydratase
MLSLAPLPHESGSYRWYYADVAAGSWTAVFIFMVGSIFSPRYSRAVDRGGRPLSHCAVNVALYRRGRRRFWLLHEYPGAEQQGERLQIGGSTFAYSRSGTVRIEIDEQRGRGPWRRPVRLSAELRPECPSLDEVRLCETEPHFWELRAARSRAWLDLGTEKGKLDLRSEPLWGYGYHDTNHGAVRLGNGLPGWSWSRAHGPHKTEVCYRLPGRAPLAVVASSGRVAFSPASPEIVPESGEPPRRSGWGLSIPRSLDARGLCGSSGDQAACHLVESSPFYARLEMASGGDHALAEVANFQRFHSPWIRWMAHFRTRRMVIKKPESR